MNNISICPMCVCLCVVACGDRGAAKQELCYGNMMPTTATGLRHHRGFGSIWLVEAEGWKSERSPSSVGVGYEILIRDERIWYTTRNGSVQSGSVELHRAVQLTLGDGLKNVEISCSMFWLSSINEQAIFVGGNDKWQRLNGLGLL